MELAEVDLDDEDFEPDLEDYLLLGMAETVAGMEQLAEMMGHETFMPTADIFGPEGEAVVTIDSQDVFTPAQERLSAIMEVARQIEVGLPTKDVARQILATDGWSFTEYALRTPTWLRDVQEWTLLELAKMHSEFA